MPSLKVVVTCLVVGTMGLSAAAQDRPQRPGRQGGDGGPPPARQPMSPEKAKAAWTLEATGAAKRAGATDDQAKAVAKAYVDARESHNAAMEKLRQAEAAKRKEKGDGDEGGGGRGGRGMDP